MSGGPSPNLPVIYIPSCHSLYSDSGVAILCHWIAESLPERADEMNKIRRMSLEDGCTALEQYFRTNIEEYSVYFVVGEYGAVLDRDRSASPPSQRDYLITRLFQTISSVQYQQTVRY